MWHALVGAVHHRVRELVMWALCSLSMSPRWTGQLTPKGYLIYAVRGRANGTDERGHFPPMAHV